MLEVRDIHTGYGRSRVLFGVSLTVKPGEIVCLMGRNGAGKTTLMKSIMGWLPLSSGLILLDNEEISALPPHEIPKRRIGFIPQGRRLFAELTVSENLEIGLMARGAGREVRERVLEMFPRLRDRLGQPAETLSGGERQMLATARALCLEPRVLLMDEPTEGLQPSMIESIQQVMLRMKSDGLAVLLVEQRFDAVLPVADVAVFIENGMNKETVDADELRSDHSKLKSYLAV